MSDEAFEEITKTDAYSTEDAGDGFAGGSAQDSYSKNQAEIQRRQELAQSNDQNPRTFERRAGAAEMPFKLDGQTHFVWSASHEGMAPRAKDPKHPALRIYGLFTKEEAIEHARVVASVDPTCSLMVSPTHEWVMLPRAPERLGEAAGHIQTVLEAYKEKRDATTKQFNENVAQHRSGVSKTAAEARQDAEASEEADESEEAPTRPHAPRRLGRDAEVRDQSIVAATFVADGTQEVGEPVFKVYGAFENTSVGDDWARAAGDTVVDYDIDLVSTCQWLFPSDVRSEKIAQEVFRSNELSNIISNAKKQPQLCENFKKWRDESESEA